MRRVGLLEPDKAPEVDTLIGFKRKNEPEKDETKKRKPREKADEISDV